VITVIASNQREAVEFTAVYQKVPEGYIAFVEELLGANTQGATLDEARTNLKGSRPSSAGSQSDAYPAVAVR
jgi:hypothetical protein